MCTGDSSAAFMTRRELNGTLLFGSQLELAYWLTDQYLLVVEVGVHSYNAHAVVFLGDHHCFISMSSVVRQSHLHTVSLCHHSRDI